MMIQGVQQCTINIPIPADWELPKFQFGQRVIVLGEFRATVLGLEWVPLEGFWHSQGCEPGWHYTVAFEPPVPKSWNPVEIRFEGDLEVCDAC